LSEYINIYVKSSILHFKLSSRCVFSFSEPVSLAVLGIFLSYQSYQSSDRVLAEVFLVKFSAVVSSSLRRGSFVEFSFLGEKS